MSTFRSGALPPAWARRPKDGTIDLLYVWVYDAKETNPSKDDDSVTGKYQVSFWQNSNSGNVCFAFYNKKGENLTQRQMMDLGLTPTDFTITVNKKSYTGKTLTNISDADGVNKAALKVNFGDAGKVLVKGDRYLVNTDGKVVDGSNIEFSFTIKGLDYTVQSGAIDITKVSPQD